MQKATAVLLVQRWLFIELLSFSADDDDVAAAQQQSDSLSKQQVGIDQQCLNCFQMQRQQQDDYPKQRDEEDCFGAQGPLFCVPEKDDQQHNGNDCQYHRQNQDVLFGEVVVHPVGAGEAQMVVYTGFFGG